ncbi:Lipase, GDSL [Corchorus capsularis]|uniref:Lipase, GDSL n=1 Tax=Corchorus capsularis TaxID=210143 RepID=A0A1R3J6B2_COCAP|nr:Lipase, GDSL [Corchorus capsularis]
MASVPPPPLRQPLFPAMFVLGDSLVDNGNNNGLSSLAKANFLPYGIDFQRGPTGRFCNGKTIIDFLGDLLGLPLLPAFTITFTGQIDIRSGVNYASAAAGILDESGQNFGDRFSFRQQVQNFGVTLNQLKNQMNEEELDHSTFNPEEFADLLITNYARQIMALYRLGLRKFLLAGVGPLGCMPNQLATGHAPPGKCVANVNDMVRIFNKQLKSLVDQLNADYTGTGSIFVFADTYGAFTDILSNPATYGFSATDRGCCGIGRNKGQITCLPFSIPCLNRDEYIFWDAYHPTQAFNEIIALKAYSGSQSLCYPINIKQMAQV